ncbi:hypothetical protein PLICRDRAFT_702050 [Plicaturopsis crispa FD-325 SS-3]|uniref:Auxin efflux carrier n=1 Tax=Plicaturopsis crispa FD-325 SS-3 TaxID=944288 RepID=A0A0C9SQV7_PLICR|nr:hypothetical protein PLICRDRAFT_702050 [Plicaturopsis crispa FD-325 SS-3]
MHSLLITLSGSIQSAVSVELTICAGYAAAMHGLLDVSGTRKISNLAWADIQKLWVFVVWSFVVLSVGFGVGWAGRCLFKLPGWMVTACAINTNTLSLLVLKPLQNTGALDKLAGWVPGETADQATDRGRIYVLLYMLVQLTYAFAAGPCWVRKDRVVEPERISCPEQPSRRRRLVGPDGELGDLFAQNDTSLAEDCETVTRSTRSSGSSLRSSPRAHILSRVWASVTYFVNPPLVGAALAAVIGVVPLLHQLFLDAHSSPLHSTITAAAKNLGELAVPLQTFTLGAQLYFSRSQAGEGYDAGALRNATPAWPAMLFVLIARFLVIPVVCVSGVYLLVSCDVKWLQRDPMIWFIMILAPQGPPTVLLSSIAEIVQLGADLEAQIATFLFISYLASPLIAIVISAAIEVIGVLQ